MGTRICQGTISSMFLHREGVYYDPIADEIFIVKLIGHYPIRTGQLVPELLADFGDETKQGAILSDGQEYLGPL